MLDKMNYNRVSDRGKLVNAVQKSVVPWLAVGNDRNLETYRILSGAHGLQADNPKPQTDRELISDNVLGVNTNVQPRNPMRRLEANLSEESTQSNDSTDSAIGGFVFHQIGIPQSWGDEPEQLQTYGDSEKASWLDTGFCVVMRFGLSDAANGVYIIYDFFPKDDTGQRGPRIKNDNWGRLWNSHPQFSLAKIADKITDLELGRIFGLTEVIEHSAELVRAVKTTHNNIVQGAIAS